MSHLLVPTGSHGPCRPHTPRPNTVADILRDRHIARLDELAADWLDEGAAAAITGNPRRAFYLEHMAQGVLAKAARVVAEPVRRVVPTPPARAAA